MAIAKKCDICGKLYETYNCNWNSNDPNGIALVTIMNNYTYSKKTLWDCCPDCMNSIQDFIESLKKKGERKDSVGYCVKVPDLF